MAGILPDLSNGPAGLLGFLSNLFSPTQANAQPATPQAPTGLMPPPISGPLPLSQRPMEALGGFLNAPGGVIGGLMGAGKTLFGGELSDPQSIQANNLRLMYRNFVAQGLTPQQALMAIMQPKIGEAAGTEVMKGTINPTMTVAPDGSILVQRPFGQINVPGGVPISERGDVVDQNGNKRPAFFVKPSLTNQSGSVAMPGAPPVSQPSALPGTRPPMVSQPVPQNDPTMTVSPRQVAQANAPMTALGPARTAELEGEGKTNQATYDQIVKNVQSANTMRPTLRVMNALNEDAYAGKAAGVQQHVGSLLTSLGMASEDVKKAVASGTMFDALGKQIVFALASGHLGTGFSEGDRRFLEDQAPALLQDARGRKLLIQYLDKVMERNQQIGRMAETYKLNNGGSISGFQNAIGQWAEQNPLFNAPPPGNFNDRFSAAYGGGQSSGGQTQPPVQGARQAPDGNWYVTDPRRPGKFLMVK